MRALTWTLVVLALVGRGAVAQALTKAEEREVAAAIEDLAASAAERREAALDRLAELVSRAPVRIEPLLQDRRPAIREAALLIYRRAPEAAKADLIALLLRDAEPPVRETAVVLYAQMQPPGWGMLLAERLAGETEMRVLRQLIVALGDSDDLRVVPLLIDALEATREPTLRSKIVQTLLTLTGERLAGSAATWRAWWQAEDRIKERAQRRDDKGGEERKTERMDHGKK